MCGICGILGREPLTPEERASVVAANAALAHRGPDGEGAHAAAQLFMAMRRLSIVDLESGWQPLYNEDRSVAVICNGEVYNYLELRAQLEGLGHRFRTGSDCETIAHLYEQHGDACVQHLRGMFAFALHDLRRNRVLLARDRMGEKPLHLVERDGLIAFASELRSLLLMGLVPFVLDPQAVDMYLRYGWVPSPGTIVRGVRELPPAHALAVELDSWSSREGCYWRMDDVAPICGDPVEVLRAELDEVARLTTRADVPIGVALSGGVDSAAVAALATGAHGGTVHAVTVGYEGRPRQDERHAAEGVARALGMAFHSVEVGLSDMVAAFHDLNFVRDVPIADGAGHGYWAISRAARAAGCPVMLQGQGADELFWGYPWVVRALKASTAKQSGADPSRPSVESLRSWLPRSLSSREVFEFVRYLSGVGLGRRRLATCAPGPRDQLVMWDMIDSYQAIDHVGAAIYPLSMRLALAGATPAACFTRARPWGSVDVLMTRVLCGGYLLQNGIRQADRLFMAASVEPRLPLLDYRFVETVVGLRKAASDAALPPKAWFKAAVREVVPQAVLRRPKQGFTPPARAWTEGLRAAYGETLLDGYLVKGGFLRRDAAHLVAQPRGRFSVWSGLLFGLLVLESWCQGVSSMLRGRPLAPPALARPAIQQAAGGQEGH